MHTHRRYGTSLIGLLAMLLAISATVSCTSKPPEFVSMTARVIAVAVDADGGREERLSFFSSVADGDGVGDIEYLFLVHDASELSWTLDQDSWVRHEEGTSVWIGSNGLRAPAGIIPRGRYRAVLVDRAGERVERSVMVSAPGTGEYALPSVNAEGDSVSVRSPYPVNTALFLDPGGNVVGSASVGTGRTPLDTLMRGGTWRTSADYIAVYGFDPKAETGFMSWKIRLQD
jgi:hypothetical protein